MIHPLIIQLTLLLPARVSVQIMEMKKIKSPKAALHRTPINKQTITTNKQVCIYEP